MAIHCAITGAKGTGKSTLLKKVDAKISGMEMTRNVKFIVSPGVEAKARNLSLGEMGSEQTHIFFATMHLKNIQYHPNQLRILDRCLIDHLAYVRTLSNSEDTIEMMSELTRVACKNYSMIFVTRLYKDLPRITDESESDEFRHSIEVEIFSILKEFNVPFIELSTSFESAVEEIINVLREMSEGS